MRGASIWTTIRNSIWLLGGCGLLGGAFFLWIGLQVHDRVTVEEVSPPSNAPVEPEKVRFSPTLGMMTDIVPELNVRRNLSNEEHDPEFKGYDFIKLRANKWTLQLLSVTQEEVIKNYLAKRADRQDFYYFRLVEENKSDRFVLTYGMFNAVTQALQKMQEIDLQLPESVKPFPARFYAYKPYVVDSNSSGDIVNLSNRNKVYQVRLRSVPVPLEAPVVIPERKTANNPVLQPIELPQENVNPLTQSTKTLPNNSAEKRVVPNEPVTAPPVEAPVQDPFN